MHQNSLRQIFAMPAAVALATVLGLLAALVGDGAWDAVSWVTLGLAVALSAWYGLPWRRSHQRGAQARRRQ